MTVPTTPAQWLKDLPLGPKEEGFLDLLLDLRQEMIDLDIIVTVLELAEAHNPALKTDPRLAFLHLVAEYHGNVRRQLKDAQQWNDLGERFEVFGRVNEMVNFYAPNYALLCFRNAGGDVSKQKVPKMFREAADASAFLTEAQRNEAMGYLQYNVARWMLKEGGHPEENVIQHWQGGGHFRTKWLQGLDRANARPYTWTAASKQVWKARAEFPQRFPNADIDDCGVPKDVFDAITAEFGEEVLKTALAK